MFIKEIIIFLQFTTQLPFTTSLSTPLKAYWKQIPEKKNLFVSAGLNKLDALDQLR